jgi:hypothetical protein
LLNKIKRRLSLIYHRELIKVEIMKHQRGNHQFMIVAKKTKQAKEAILNLSKIKRGDLINSLKTNFKMIKRKVHLERHKI